MRHFHSSEYKIASSIPRNNLGMEDEKPCWCFVDVVLLCFSSWLESVSLSFTYFPFPPFFSFLFPYKNPLLLLKSKKIWRSFLQWISILIRSYGVRRAPLYVFFLPFYILQATRNIFILLPCSPLLTIDDMLVSLSGFSPYSCVFLSE